MFPISTTIIAFPFKYFSASFITKAAQLVTKLLSFFVLISESHGRTFSDKKVNVKNDAFVADVKRVPSDESVRKLPHCPL